jgi:hypothetical protein
MYDQVTVFLRENVVTCSKHSQTGAISFKLAHAGLAEAAGKTNQLFSKIFNKTWEPFSAFSA